MNRKELARLIDHTALGADVTQGRIQALCSEAVAHGFGAVCVPSYAVPRAAAYLRGADVTVCTVVGFPLGAHPAAVKAFETARAVEDGAGEIDAVLNVAALLDARTDVVGGEIREVVAAAGGRTVKIILETGFLGEDEVRLACRLAEQGGAAFVKTSTGFGPRGASAEDVRLMRDACSLAVKASGGIRDYETARALIEAGAARIGASASLRILEGCPE